MAWTYAALQTAIAALNPMPPDTASIAAAINAQTTAPGVDLAASTIEQIIVPTGELFAIQQYAAKPTSGSNPPSAGDVPIISAWNFNQMLARWPLIQTSNPTIWTACQAAMAALLAAEVLSQASVTAIEALQSAPQPVWVPAVSSGDVQTALAQP